MAETNTNLPGPDTLADWLRQYRTQKRVCDSETGKLRAILKKADADGVNTKAMVAAVRATKQDPESVTQLLRDTLQAMAILRIDVSRDEIFSWDATVTDKTMALDDEWTAQDRGFKAGRDGVPVSDCPYPAGSEFSVQWRNHWAAGQRSLAMELGPQERVASAERKRPSRKAAADAPAPEPTAKKGRKGGGGRRKEAAPMEAAGSPTIN